MKYDFPVLYESISLVDGIHNTGGLKGCVCREGTTSTCAAYEVDE